MYTFRHDTTYSVFNLASQFQPGLGRTNQSSTFHLTYQNVSNAKSKTLLVIETYQYNNKNSFAFKKS